MKTIRIRKTNNAKLRKTKTKRLLSNGRTVQNSNTSFQTQLPGCSCTIIRISHRDQTIKIIRYLRQELNKHGKILVFMILGFCRGVGFSLPLKSNRQRWMICGSDKLSVCSAASTTPISPKIVRIVQREISRFLLILFFVNKNVQKIKMKLKR